MKISVLGSGNVGQVLAARLSELGHEVTIGSRDPNGTRTRDLKAILPDDVQICSVQASVADAELVMLAVPWLAVETTLAAAGSLRGKILIDCTNPIGEGLKELVVGGGTSAAEKIAEKVPDARVVKAFNTTGSINMANPQFGKDRATMFVCGNDLEAKKIVLKIVEELGFEAIDAGDLKIARYLEPLAMLWIHLAVFKGYGPEIAFKLLRRD